MASKKRRQMSPGYLANGIRAMYMSFTCQTLTELENVTSDIIRLASDHITMPA